MAHQNFKLNPKLSGDPHLRLNVNLAFDCDRRLNDTLSATHSVDTGTHSNRHYAVLWGSEWTFETTGDVKQIIECTKDGCAEAKKYKVTIEVIPTLHTWNLITAIAGAFFVDAEGRQSNTKAKKKFTITTKCICCKEAAD